MEGTYSLHDEVIVNEKSCSLPEKRVKQIVKFLQQEIKLNKKAKKHGAENKTDQEIVTPRDRPNISI